MVLLRDYEINMCLQLQTVLCTVCLC